MKPIHLSTVIESLTRKLQCSQRGLASLLNLDKNTISNNNDKIISEITSKTPKTIRKILVLFILISKHLPALEADAIHKIITTHIYKNYSGETDSVLSSIQQLKHEFEILEFIIQKSKSEYEDQRRAESPLDLEDPSNNLLCA